MLRIYKILAVGLISLTHISQALGSETTSPPVCSSAICTVDVISSRLVHDPCKGMDVMMAFSTLTGATLIQCSLPNIIDNVTLVFDRYHPSEDTFEIEAGRFFSPEYMVKAETVGIPDQFGRVPLCAKGHASSEGQLVVVTKELGKSEKIPYCYRVISIKSDKDGLNIVADDGSKMPPLSKKEAKKWEKMRRALSPFIKAPSVQMQGLK